VGLGDEGLQIELEDVPKGALGLRKPAGIIGCHLVSLTGNLNERSPLGGFRPQEDRQTDKPLVSHRGHLHLP
jgi:hypothetical protein